MMKEELLFLLKKEAFFKKKVKLSSGRVSDYYIDVRKVSLTPRGIYLITHLFWPLLKKETVTAIGGPTLGADPIVSGLCMLAYKKRMEWKGFLIRKTPKKHGQQKLIEGKELNSKDKVVLVDDVATTGSSLVKAIEILRSYKVKIAKAIVVVDREEGAKDTLAQLGCPLFSLFVKNDFV